MNEAATIDNSVDAAPVSVEQSMAFDGLLPPEQLIWIGVGLVVLFTILTIRDAMLARRKWVVPLLLFMRMVACAGVLLALAAPSEVTRKTFETQRGIGIYVDSSASMGLIDAADGEGHLARWQLAAAGGDDSALDAIDRASTRVDVALAMVSAAVANAGDEETQSALEMLNEQIAAALEDLEEHDKHLPFPSLAEDVHAALKASLDGDFVGLQETLSTTSTDTVTRSRGFSDQFDQARLDIDESLQKLAAISRELARREEASGGNTSSDLDTVSRLDWASQTLRQVESRAVSKFGKDIDVLRAEFSEHPSSVDARWNLSHALPADPDSPADDDEVKKPLTDLSAALTEIASQHRDNRIDAAVIITDGVHNSDGRPLEIPPGLENFPLLVVPAGGDARLDDITLWRAYAPETLMRGDYLSVDCLIGSRGFAGQTTTVRLLADETELDSVEITFTDDGEDQQVRLSTPIIETGQRDFEVEIVSLEGEKYTANNRESISVEVSSGDLKVLLIDGWPRWETRYLSNLLKRDDTAQHHEILLSPPSTSILPTTLIGSDALDSYNVIIIGEVSPDFLDTTQLAALEKFVDSGGSLIVLAGREHMPGAFADSRLSELLPVRLDLQRELPSAGCRLVPTLTGRRIAALSLEDDPDQNTAVWQLGSSRLQLSELSPYNVPKPGAQVILEAHPLDQSDAADALPYIVWHRFGGGRVFYLPSPTTYFLRYRFGDRYHYRFWGQFLRWATKAEMNAGNTLVKISTDARRYPEDATPRIEVELVDADGAALDNARPSIQLQRAGKEIGRYRSTEIAGSEGRYAATLPPLSHGSYQARVVGPSVDTLLTDAEEAPSSEDETPGLTSFIVVAKPSNENGTYSCEWETARRIANSTGGVVIPPDGLEAALGILSHTSGKRFRETVTRTALWDRWPLLFLILIFLCFEWIGRKYAGLI